MKAMIFAAGKGTRLKPLTDSIPKALVEINGTPMLEIVIHKLIKSGVHEIIINVHHLANQIIDFLNTKNNFGIRIEISHEKDQLLDTGGGLKKAAWFFDDNKPFIVHNVDVISNIDLNEILEYHKKNNALATLAVRNRISSRYFLFNGKNHLCGWENTKTGETINNAANQESTPLAFSGIHVIHPKIFNLMDDAAKFSIVKSYLKLSRQFPVLAYKHDQDYWFDIGKPENLTNASMFLKRLSKI